MRNFRASEWKSLLLRNERSRKCRICETNAEIAQLVEHNLAKVGVASSSLVFRSKVDCPGGGMVDALVSGASVERRAGSSPVLGTERFLKLYQWRGGGIGRRATLRG